MADKNIIALDVGGSSVKSGLVDFQLRVHHVTKTPIDSHGSAETILTTLRDIIQVHITQIDTAALVGVGFGFPSPFEYEAGISHIRGLEKYEGIYGVNIRDALQVRLAMPNLRIVFRNDAEAAIVGEVKFGAGKPYHRLIGVTLGTGMGSSFVVDGRRVSSGAGVPPHEGFLFPELYKGERSDDVFSTRGLLARFEAAGFVIEGIGSAKAAADRGDAGVQAVFAQFGADLGDFLHPYAIDFSAEAVLVLGGISGAIAYFHEAMSKALPVPVVGGTLGSDAALLGAAEPLLERVERH